MMNQLKTAIAVSLMGVAVLGGATLEECSDNKKVKVETTRNVISVVDIAEVERPDVKKLVEMMEDKEKAETTVVTTTSNVTTQTTMMSACTSKVSELITTTTEEEATTSQPEVTTTEWYMSVFDGFGVPVDAEGNDLDQFPECEPAGVFSEMEETTPTETEEITTTETTDELPEYGSDAYLLAYAMSREAADFTDAYYVGNVILNRVEDPDFPNSILEVLQQPLQYDWGVSSYERRYIYDDRFYEIAQELLAGKRLLPKNVVYQAQFVQGSGIYIQYKVHYYCFK